MVGYDAGPQDAPGAFRLAGNENPFPPLPGVIEATLGADPSRYPDATSSALRRALARRHGVEEPAVHTSGGSVAVIYQFLSALTGPGDEVVLAGTTFEAYPKAITVAGSTAVRVPNLPDGSHDLDGMIAAIGPATRAILVCSPNNPTSNAIPASTFASFIDRVPSHVPVLLDEAYVEFVTDDDPLDGPALLADHTNLFVLRTFSKAYGLAGVRVGYALGDPGVLAAIRRVAVPFLVSSAAEAAAIASLERGRELADRVRAITDARDRIIGALRAQGWDLPDSGGNFVWLPAGPATTDVAAVFRHHGLLVRAFPDAGVRVTIGEVESHGLVVEAAASARALVAP